MQIVHQEQSVMAKAIACADLVLFLIQMDQAISKDQTAEGIVTAPTAIVVMETEIVYLPIVGQTKHATKATATTYAIVTVQTADQGMDALI